MNGSTWMPCIDGVSPQRDGSNGIGTMDVWLKASTSVKLTTGPAGSSTLTSRV